MDQPPKRAYTRTSYDCKEGESISGQLQMFREYTQHHGYNVLGEFIDHSVSGANLDVPT